jgi:hypothetical protein
MSFQRAVAELMKAARVARLSVAILNDNKVTYVRRL